MGALLMIAENWNGIASLLRGWTRGSRGVAVRRRGRAVSVGQCGTDGNRPPPEKTNRKREAERDAEHTCNTASG